MATSEPRSLLAVGDPPAVRISNPEGRSLFLLLGDHAGNRIPRQLGMLGLGPEELARHIAWDIGVAGLGKLLAAKLDAPFVEQSYSRLVVDCNRAPSAPDAFAPASDGTLVPGNRDLTAKDREMRIAAILDPYHDRIAETVAARREQGRGCVLVSLHSFTPVFGGTPRPWEIGVLHDGGDARFAVAVLDRLRADGRFRVGENVPYRMDATDYTVPRHAYGAGLPYVELEIRQDLLGDRAAQTRMAEHLAQALTAALPGE